MNPSYYKYCIVPQCESTTIKTPNKLFIYVPNNKQIRKKWLTLARRDNVHTLSTDSRMYFCEDHFDITYVAVEHPNIVYCNKKFISECSSTSRRYSRSDPTYYYNLNFTAHVGFGNNLSLDFYFYELLTNQYKPTFVEMHFKMCSLVNKNDFFGTALRKAMIDMPCPYSPGRYVLKNMTIPSEAIPRAFPFTKGRIICNSSWVGTGEQVFSGYVDMELKTMKKLVVKNN